MKITNRPELSEAEKKLPLAKYYDIPLEPLGPLQQQIIDAGPIDPGLALKPENLLDLLKPEGYAKAEYGYCMMDDGAGYLATYSVYPGCTTRMMGWWFRWLNVHTKGMPEGQGNLKYKIWCPPDHFDHGFINKKDGADGIYTVESLDLGQGESKIYSVRHPINLRDLGLTEERERELKAAGCWFDCAWVSYHSLEEPHRELPGTILSLSLSRPYPFGGVEKCFRVWVGYGMKDGKLYFNSETPASMLCDAYLKKIQIHATVEAQHLAKFLPQLYEEYHDRPDWED